MAVRKINIETLVRKLDPEQKNKKEPVYVFGGRVVKSEDPHTPGKPYKWVNN